MTIQAAFLITCVILLITTLIIAYDHIVVARVPFIRLKISTIQEILSQVQIKPKDIVYDLGCGDGRVLIQAVKIQPKATYIGIEKAILPYFLACFYTRKHTQITIHRVDILKYDYSDAEMVFIYLLPDLIKKLQPQLRKLIKNSKTVIAVEFAPAEVRPKEIHTLKQPSKFGHTWFLY
ncbi:hypothetical protein H0W80_02200 [Candidatus Saccharibacteria bacterium]|nr:hypothetical protein [Candidatus Saccharibacteria bacterium]